MSQLKLMEPQFECGLFEIWCVGIIDSLIYRVNGGQDDVSLDLLNLRSMKSELYEIILSKTGYLVRKICADLCDPCDKLTFKSRFIDLIFLNVLREKQLLTEPTEYYYESVVDIFSKVNFGLAFIIDVIADQGWYKYESKFLTRFTDENQVKLITTKLRTLSSDFHLNVLFVIWNIERVLNDDDDIQALLKFKVSADHLLNQSTIKMFDFKDNLAIYLALVNVTLEELVGAVAREVSRMLGLDKQNETEDLVNPILPKVKVTLKSIESITSFINDLDEKLFPNQQLDDIENLKSCLKDPKSETIVEMIASIIELNSFLNILRQEISFPKVTFKGFDTIMIGWDEWSQVVNFDEILCQEVLTLKRFFVQEREECRYLTCLIIKHGLPKYFDILEAIDLELYLDPYVIFTFCDVLQTTTDKEGDDDLLEDMVLVLKRVLTSIKSKKRISFIVRARAHFFGLYNLGNVKKAKLTTLLRQKSGALRYDHLRSEILLAAFLAPYEVLEFIVGDTLEHSHHMIPFLSKLFCIELNSLMASSCETKYNNSLFEVIVNSRLTILPTETTVSGLLKLIKEIFIIHLNTKKPIQNPILSLERLMCHLAWESCLDAKPIASAKVAIYKLIQNLTDEYEIAWPMVEKEPSSLLYSLITMTDYYYIDGCAKEAFVELIAFIMNKKVRRKITSREFYWIKNRIEYLGESLILIAYLQPWLEERLSFYLDIKEFTLSETLVLASICKDNVWIFHSTKHNLDSYSNDMFKKGISGVLRFLCRQEYDNLFLFLCHHSQIDVAMMDICEGFSSLEPSVKVNTEYMTRCMIDCLYSHYLEYFKNPAKYTPARQIGSFSVISEERFLPLFFRRLALCLNLKDPVNQENIILNDFLERLSKEMADKGIEANQAIFSKNITINFTAVLILRMHHKRCFYEAPKIKDRLMPG